MSRSCSCTVSAAPGRTSGRRSWRELAESFRVVAYDVRGSGRSDAPPGPYTVGGLADDLQALLVTLGYERVAIVGHSMGGGIALELAGRDPARVRAVVGVGAVAELPEQGRAGMAARAETVEAEGMVAVAETVATNGLAPSFRASLSRGLPGVRLADSRPTVRRATRRSAVRSYRWPSTSSG